jgi:hypothetical protein
MLTDKVVLSVGFGVLRRWESGGTDAKCAGTATRPFRRVRGKCTGIVAKPSGFGVREPIHHGEW